MKKNISNNDDIVVSVKDLSKSFKLPHNKQNSIKSALINIVKGGDRSFETQKVLKDISFDIKKGDFFGIVGRNGSGKSTLLKLLSGIYNPDKGSIKIEGSVVPFIELGVGFNPELTGKENVFLNGALLGFSHADMVKMYDDIVEFAELGRFMDQKLKNYSSGMQVRLAFSIAIKAQGDILILDEVLAVGDEAFQRKCNDFFESIKKDKSKTVILVTHSMGSVKQYCNKAMMIRDGEVIAIGSPEDVANEYSLENLETNTNVEIDGKVKSNDPNERKSSPPIEYLHIEMLNDKSINQEESVKARMIFKSNLDETVTLVCGVSDIKRNCATIDSHYHDLNIKKGKKYSVLYTHDLRTINSGEFRINAQIFNKESVSIAWVEEKNKPIFLYNRNDLSSREHFGDPSTYGVILDRSNWVIENEA